MHRWSIGQARSWQGRQNAGAVRMTGDGAAADIVRLEAIGTGQPVRLVERAPAVREPLRQGLPQEFARRPETVDIDLAHQLAEPMAATIVALAAGYDAIVAAATTIIENARYASLITIGEGGQPARLQPQQRAVQGLERPVGDLPATGHLHSRPSTPRRSSRLVHHRTVPIET